MSMILWGKFLSVEWRTGTGIDIEWCQTRPVWTHNTNTGKTEAMPFEGVVILLPCIIISYGLAYTFTEEEDGGWHS